MQIVFPTGSLEFELTNGSEDHIASENIHIYLLDVVTILINVLLGETKIDKTNLIHGALFLGVVPHKNVIQFKIVVGKSCCMDHFNDVYELESYLYYGLHR